MNNGQIDGLKGFDQVWNRVSGSQTAAAYGSQPPEASASEESLKQMRQFMDDEAHDSALYKTLAARTSGSASSALMSMSRDEAGHLKALQLEYFLRSGDTYKPRVELPALQGLLAELRRAYFSEMEGSKAYAAAAAQAQGDSLRALYAANSADEARHSEMLRNILSRAIK